MDKATRQKSGNGDRESAWRGNGDVFGNILKTVSGGIAEAAGGAEKVGPLFLAAVTEVVQRALSGAVGMGDNLVMGTKAIIVGVVRGIGEKGEAALVLLSHAARSVLRNAAGMGADLAACTKGLILGAIASAKDLGVDRGKSASAAAQGALDGAHDVGSVAVDKVRDALKEAIGGVKVGIPEPSRSESLQ